MINAHDVRAGEDIRTNDAPPPSALSSSAHDERLQTIKQGHPRAYERWTEDEDTEQPSAIRSRLAKLSPGSDLDAPEFVELLLTAFLRAQVSSVMLRWPAI